ncbi:MAG TPA: hypothetical protein DD638_09545 [Pasteurellaceae bacterium]|nr:hypothetical protein [Pasteurellaceae bacterium]
MGKQKPANAQLKRLNPSGMFSLSILYVLTLLCGRLYSKKCGCLSRISNLKRILIRTTTDNPYQQNRYSLHAYWHYRLV